MACSQFRCRDLYDSTVYLYAANDPVIESSGNLVFAPYNLTYPEQRQHAANANLKIGKLLPLSHTADENKWDLIFDFTKQASGDLNFQVMDPSEWSLDNKQIEGFDGEGDVVFPYPERYGGTIANDA